MAPLSRGSGLGASSLCLVFFALCQGCVNTLQDPGVDAPKNGIYVVPQKPFQPEKHAADPTPALDRPSSSLRWTPVPEKESFPREDRNVDATTQAKTATNTECDFNCQNSRRIESEERQKRYHAEMVLRDTRRRTRAEYLTYQRQKALYKRKYVLQRQQKIATGMIQRRIAKAQRARFVHTYKAMRKASLQKVQSVSRSVVNLGDKMKKIDALTTKGLVAYKKNADNSMARQSRAMLNFDHQARISLGKLQSVEANAELQRGIIKQHAKEQIKLLRRRNQKNMDAIATIFEYLAKFRKGVEALKMELPSRFNTLKDSEELQNETKEKIMAKKKANLATMLNLEHMRVDLVQMKKFAAKHETGVQEHETTTQNMMFKAPEWISRLAQLKEHARTTIAQDRMTLQNFQAQMQQEVKEVENYHKTGDDVGNRVSLRILKGIMSQFVPPPPVAKDGVPDASSGFHSKAPFTMSTPKVDERTGTHEIRSMILSLQSCEKCDYLAMIENYLVEKVAMKVTAELNLSLKKNIIVSPTIAEEATIGEETAGEAPKLDEDDKPKSVGSEETDPGLEEVKESEPAMMKEPEDDSGSAVGSEHE